MKKNRIILIAVLTGLFFSQTGIAQNDDYKSTISVNAGFSPLFGGASRSVGL